MGRKSKNKQADPEPVAKEHTKTKEYVRSGGKRKYIGASAKPTTPSKKEKGKAKETEEDELEAARAAYFDPEDLVDQYGDAGDSEDSFAFEDEGIEDGLPEEDDEFDIPEEEDEPTEEPVETDALPRLPATAFAPAQEEEDEEEEQDDEELAILQNAGSDEDSDLELELLQDVDETAERPSIHLVKARLATAVKVLTNWKALGAQTGKSRSEIYDQFLADVCEYYGYNQFLAEKLIELFPIDEAIAFLDASDTPRPITIRTNTLKTKRRDLAQALVNRGVNLEPIGSWTKVGLQIFEAGGIPIGATPEYMAGHYILQAASSFLPVVALQPQPHEKVLDMSAAPGGKTTYLSAMLQNTGVVFANDASKTRSKALAANVARLGCKNVVICNYDGRDFPKVMGGFDRVLLDAPCSGTGVISKDASVKVNKSERDFQLLSQLQKQLILCAIDSVSTTSKTGGYLVYSTCSVTVDENEDVVAYALKKRPNVKLVDTGIEFGKPGFKSFKGRVFGDEMQKVRRFYPHVTNMDGFFVAKFKVNKPQKKKPATEEEEEEEEAQTTQAGDDQANGVTTETAFDDAEDADIIQAGIKKSLKRKGLKPVDVEKGKAKKRRKEEARAATED